MNRRSLLAWSGLALTTVTGDGEPTEMDTSGSAPGNADSDTWPETFFAPYHNLMIEQEVPVAVWGDVADTDYLHIAFIHAGPEDQPAWSGDEYHVVGESLFDDEIRSFQEDGGNVIVSFGGAAGDYLAGAIEDPIQLVEAFELIVNEYGVDYFDVNDEKPDQAVFDRRNEALAIMQDRRPELKVEYTLRADTGGIGTDDLPILDSAIDHGVDIEVVNPMTMNYGYVPPRAEHCISTLEGTHDQLADRFPDRSDSELWSMIGATPHIGQNPLGGAFYPDDARGLQEFARERGVRMLSFWAVERDKPGPLGVISPVHSGINQDYYEFSEIFNRHNP